MDGSVIFASLFGFFFCALFGGVAAFFWYTGRKGTEAAAELARRKQSARPALAVIKTLATRQYGTLDGGRVTTDAHVDLEIESEPGMTLTAVWTVDPAHLPRLDPGARINVIIDRMAPAKVFPAETWLRSSGMDPNIHFA